MSVKLTNYIIENYDSLMQQFEELSNTSKDFELFCEETYKQQQKVR